MKKSNIIPSKISVQIFSGLSLISQSNNFENIESARVSAERIIRFKDKLIGEGMNAYAMVFEGKKMIYYFD